jgi:hypothetical protein
LFREHQLFWVHRKMSTNWSIRFQVGSSCHLRDEPLIGIFENAERMRMRVIESNIVSVNNETVKMSNCQINSFVCRFYSRLRFHHLSNRSEVACGWWKWILRYW